MHGLESGREQGQRTFNTEAIVAVVPTTAVPVDMAARPARPTGSAPEHGQRGPFAERARAH